MLCDLAVIYDGTRIVLCGIIGVSAGGKTASMIFTGKMMAAGITRNVFIVSLVSFFNDIASEMIYPVVPIFLTTMLGVPVSIVGFIEGIAEATASILKVLSGWYSDRFSRRKPFALAGYGLSSLSKPVIAMAAAWPGVLAGRFLDRFGKGIRTSARDALIAESSESRYRGRVFGFHRALDTAGALIGPLVTFVLLGHFQNNFRLIFYLASVPAVIGVLLLALFVRDVRRVKVSPEGSSLRLRDIELTGDFKVFLAAGAVFAIGNSSDAFLILRAQNLGFSLAMIIFLYTAFNATYALFSFPAGIFSDKIGQRRVLMVSFAVFALVYAMFGIVRGPRLLWVLFPFYGICMALSEGVGKAYISLLVRKEHLGTCYGLYQTFMGICSFLSSLAAGFLWQYAGPGTPFLFGGAMAVIALAIMVKGSRGRALHV